MGGTIGPKMGKGVFRENPIPCGSVIDGKHVTGFQYIGRALNETLHSRVDVSDKPVWILCKNTGINTRIAPEMSCHFRNRGYWDVDLLELHSIGGGFIFFRTKKVL